ncbi:MAG: hypothetical protein A2107_09470 [Verrucomicrobia bacterium GWF2_62_7]|nr:MAG: hypothetical protein A2107_09470 [Verrucomicrobia bacterium GWF2_62_7]
MPAAPHKPKELAVLTWPLRSLWGRALKEAVSDPFTVRTGIAVRHIENVGVDYPTDFWAAFRSGGVPPVDVVYGNTVPALQCAQAGLCDPLDEDAFPILRVLHPRANAAWEGLRRWSVVAAYDIRYALMFRDAAFPDGPPRSWAVTLDPRFKGRVSLYPGGKGFFPVAQVMGGGRLEDIPERMEPCWSFLRELRSNVGAMGFNTQMTERVKAGGIDMFFTVLTNIRQWKADGCGVSWAVPKEGVSVADDSLHVPRGLPPERAYWAKQYVVHAMSKDSQRQWCHRIGACPMHPGIEPPPDLAGNPVYPDNPSDFRHGLFVPNRILAQYESTAWAAEFDRIMNS